LAMDIQRYLGNEPVTARPPSNLYRFQKLVRRNKTTFAAVGAVAAALVFGLGLSLYFLQRAIAAERKQAGLRQQAEAGLAAEAKMRKQAELGKIYSEAGLLLSQRRVAEAEKLLNETPVYPPAASLFSVLGTIHATREEWRAAITNFTKVVTLMPSDHATYHFLAALFVQTGDLEMYGRHRGEILRQFGQTTDPVTAERMAKDCLILPPPAADLQAIARMADVAIAAGSTSKPWPFFQFAKGLTEYRQGRFESAAEWSAKVAVVKWDLYLTVQAHMVLGMAQQQLGKTNEARATLAQGLEMADTRFPKSGKKNLDGQWNDWIIAHALMREAKALIEPNATNAADVLK